MFKKDCKKVKEIKSRISELSSDVIHLACDINCISEVIFDYCAYNDSPTTANIMILAEVMKQKGRNLVERMDLESIEISQL